MRKPAGITLTLAAVVGMAACSRRGPDPCQPATFNEQACQNAVVHGGYSHPYPYYYDSYRTYVSRGGTVAAPAGSVERGGFGSSGEAHGSGGSGVGE